MFHDLIVTRIFDPSVTFENDTFSGSLLLQTEEKLLDRFFRKEKIMQSYVEVTLFETIPHEKTNLMASNIMPTFLTL